MNEFLGERSLFDVSGHESKVKGRDCRRISFVEPIRFFGFEVVRFVGHRRVIDEVLARDFGREQVVPGSRVIR